MTDYFLTPAVLPSRTQRVALRLLHFIGWKVNFRPLPGPRGVIIVYPHTSNWDFPVGLLTKWAIGLRLHWLGKEALFKGLCGTLLGPLFRYWGGEPIERGASTGAIQRLAQRINAADYFWLALAPEGTRKYREAWRSGFYHIALNARVPLGVACIDYRTRQVRLIDYLTLTGDKDADLANIRAVYADCVGLKPACAAPIDFHVAQTGAQDNAAAQPDTLT